jgi:hypothetical protein
MTTMINALELMMDSAYCFTDWTHSLIDLLID